MRIVLSDKMTPKEKNIAWFKISNEIALRQSVDREIDIFDLTIPYEKRTKNEYIIDPSLEKDYFRNYSRNKIIIPIENIESNDNYIFKIETSQSYRKRNGMLPIDILLFCSSINDSLVKEMCNIITDTYRKKWENKISVETYGLCGDINESLICTYEDMGYKCLDEPDEQFYPYPCKIIKKKKGLAKKIAFAMQFYLRDMQFISDTESESFKDGRETYSDNVDLLGIYKVVIKRAPEEVKTNTLRDW